MKRIYLAQDISQAQLVVDMLEQAYIPALIQNAHQAGGLGELAVIYPEVWLERAQDEARARAVLAQFESEAVTLNEEAICPHCHERNPANFDLCWACSTDLIK